MHAIQGAVGTVGNVVGFIIDSEERERALWDMWGWDNQPGVGPHPGVFWAVWGEQFLDTLAGVLLSLVAAVLAYALGRALLWMNRPGPSP